MKTLSCARYRLALVPIWTTLVLVFAAGCTENAATGERRPIPSPVNGVIRQDCDIIARSDYYLSTEEENWFAENCDRTDCATIRGTDYRSTAERQWYLANCR